MRTPVMTKLILSAAAAAVILLPAVSAQAQQSMATHNNTIGTIGDIDKNKFHAKIRSLPGLNFSTLGLFGDSEVYRMPNAPRPFVFPFPVFGSSGYNFDGVTYDEYLTIVANSYELADQADYLLMFRYQNTNTIAGNYTFSVFPSLTDQFNSELQDKIDSYPDISGFPPAIQALYIEDYESYRAQLIDYYEEITITYLHEQDFLAGGGYLPLPDETNTATDPGEFTQLPTADDTAELASTIAAGLEDQALADALLEAVASSSSSQAETQAPAVSVVPEPATLGLITLGASALLTRSRRR